MRGAPEVDPSPTAGRPTRQQALKAATFDLLRDSAWELFVEQGYDSTTVEQIAARAGTSRATFYLHFEKKSATVLAHLESRIVPETLTYYERLEALGLPTREQLLDWLDSALTYFHEHRVELEVVQAASAVEPDLAERGYRVAVQCADVMVTHQQAWGPEGRDEARTRVCLLIFQLNETARLLAQGRLGVDRATALRIQLDLWTAGLALPPG